MTSQEAIDVGTPLFDELGGNELLAFDASELVAMPEPWLLDKTALRAMQELLVAQLAGQDVTVTGWTTDHAILLRELTQPLPVAAPKQLLGLLDQEPMEADPPPLTDESV